MNLISYLQSNGYQLIPEGRQFKLAEHDSLYIRDNQWYWFSQGKGGKTLDFLTQYEGKSFVDAMRELVGEPMEVGDNPQWQQKQPRAQREPLRAAEGLMLNEMMKPEYCSYYAQLLGVDVSGDTDIDEILDLLPDEKGAEVVRAAMTKLGAPYVLGAKGDDKFDCSGLVYWAINEVDPDLGSHFWCCAADQAYHCENMTVEENDLRPGDLVFWVNRKCSGCGRWNEVHHTGIYIGMGKVIEASSSKGRVVIRDLWSTTNYPIFMFARPYN